MDRKKFTEKFCRASMTVLMLVIAFLLIFVIILPEGTKIEIFASVSGENGTNAQLAKIHAMIRELANDIGHTFQELKLEAKRKTGLCFVKDKQEYCKSFKDCSKQELNLVIQSLIEMGDFTGLNLR